ncbi:apoptosis-enhancing nuclease [Salminus brasiliensis]|uniref:apoptosis-enhancing nuclease n=1 Tax=Salminus brasiliensis TaxID=930266 RepID=UPI003B82D862
MSTPDPLSNSGVAQNIWGPLNIESTLISVWKEDRKPRRKEKENSVECQMMSIEKSRKRKSSENLQVKSRGVSPFPSDASDSRHGVPSDLSLDSALPVKNKRAKITLLPAIGRTASSLCDSWDVDSGFSSETSPPTSGRSSPCVGIHPSMLVAIDCEMVGTGPNGRCSELARCSLLNYSGTVIYDKYVLPQQPVTNFRTQWSGIRKEHLKQAMPFEEARKEILHILKGKVVIGHALHNDFRALGITVPHHMIRDTSRIHLLRQLYGVSRKCVSLKKLASKLLNRNIQVGRAGHCSVEDALAALDLYKLVEEQWEKSLQDHIQNPVSIPEPTSSLEHYMQDEYWPESLTDCNE